MVLNLWVILRSMVSVRVPDDSTCTLPTARANVAIAPRTAVWHVRTHPQQTDLCVGQAGLHADAREPGLAVDAAHTPYCFGTSPARAGGVVGCCLAVQCGCVRAGRGWVIGYIGKRRERMLPYCSAIVLRLKTRWRNGHLSLSIPTDGL